jgi:hypothetical protein
VGDLLAAAIREREVLNRYYAINAVSRLMKTDVRDKPVEEMDIEKSRLKTLELLLKMK